MASYKIVWKKSAKKDLKKLDKSIVPKILTAIESLSDNPYPSGVRKLVGSVNNYRIRIGQYRVIYRIESSCLVIEIIRVGHRQGIY